MPILLSLETSTQYCSVALHTDGALISERVMNEPRSAASQLAMMIKEMIDEVKISTNQIAGVIVAAGPGSYTGLRIGVATAKGLAYALDVPIISVNTLELMAYQFIQTESKRITDTKFLMCPMIDARRMEVYCALFDKELNTMDSVQAKIIESSSFAEVLETNRVFFFGDGADKCSKIISHHNADFILNVNPKASYIGELGFKKFSSGEFEDIVSFEPYYLKDFLIRKPNEV